MLRLLTIPVFVFLITIAFHERIVAQEPRLFQFDPVELAADRRVKGSADWSEVRGRYRYQFVSEESRAKFLKDPDAYEIQLGGACARMGSLSGTGQIDLFARHDGKLYLFASDSCQKTFLAAPEKRLLNEDAAPTPSADAIAQGEKLRARMLAAISDDAHWKKLTSLESDSTEVVTSGGTAYQHHMHWTMGAPQQVRFDESWTENVYSRIVTSDAAWFDDAGTIRDMVPVARRDARHASVLEFPGLINLLLDDSATCFIEPSVSADNDPQLVVFADGFRNVITVDDQCRIVSVSTKALDSSATVATVTTTFSDFQNVDGFQLPMSSKSGSEARPATASVSWRWTVNGELQPSTFRREGEAPAEPRRAP